MAGLAYDLEGLDPAQFGVPLVPPAPSTESPQNATELHEHSWASLLRDHEAAQMAATWNRWQPGWGPAWWW